MRAWNRVAFLPEQRVGPHDLSSCLPEPPITTRTTCLISAAIVVAVRYAFRLKFLGRNASISLSENVISPIFVRASCAFL